MKRELRDILITPLSPTYWFSTRRHDAAFWAGGPELKGKSIKRSSMMYFIVSIISLAAVQLIDDWNTSTGYSTDPRSIWSLRFYLWVLPSSRCIEMSIAFVRDALDQFDNIEPTSTLKFRERVRMLFFSYGEVINNFAIIYFLLPKNYFNCEFSSILEALYFSGVTIATIGYGDIHPTYGASQLLVVYEVFCGLALLLVAFAVYTSQGLGKGTAERNDAGDLSSDKPIEPG